MERPAAGSVGGHPNDGRVVVELTSEQSDIISRATGVHLRRLGYTTTQAAGVALLATALAAGHSSLVTRRLVELELSGEQSATIQAHIGGSAPTTWLVDADHAPVRYDEELPVVVTGRGSRGLVVPAVTNEPVDGRLVVRLPSSLDGVFGTGRHTATRLAAGLIEELLTPGDRVIDVGTGSGVLAVFALRLGASFVRALDTSAAAIEAATETAELNGVADRMELVLGELQPGAPAADLVVANILAGVLLDMLPRLAATVRSGGVLVTSGVVDARAPEVTAAARAVGFDHATSASAQGWTASAFVRT